MKFSSGHRHEGRRRGYLRGRRRVWIAAVALVVAFSLVIARLFV